MRESYGEAFWMVWCPQGHAPTVRHPSAAHALNEAERLARTNPGREFYVLVATDMRQVAEPMQRVRLDPPVPF